MDAKALRNATFTLHRYYIWANRMRTHLEEKLPIFSEQLKKNPNIWTDEGIETFMYMSYWYAGLYVVIEGWRTLKLSDADVDGLLSITKNVELLKKYRHGVYHYQRNYFDNRFMNFMTKGQNVIAWVRNLNLAFGAYFLNQPRPQSMAQADHVNNPPSSRP